MRKLFLLSTLVVFSTINLHATCVSAGVVVNTLNTGAAGAAVTNSAITGGGCSATAQMLILTVVNQSGSAGGSVVMSLYNNATCTGSPVMQISAGALATHGSMGNGTVMFPVAWSLPGATSVYCWNVPGVTGFVVTAGFIGTWQ